MFILCNSVVENPNPLAVDVMCLELLAFQWKYQARK